MDGVDAVLDVTPGFWDELQNGRDSWMVAMDAMLSSQLVMDARVGSHGCRVWVAVPTQDDAVVDGDHFIGLQRLQRRIQARVAKALAALAGRKYHVARSKHSGEELVVLLPERKQAQAQVPEIPPVDRDR